MSKYAMGALAILATVGISGFVGYEYRSAECERASLSASEAAANAITSLARQYAQAEALHRGERAKRKAAYSRGLEDGRHETTKLPDRSCGWSPDERGVLQQTYCSAFPNAPSCGMSREVHTATSATAERK